MRLKTNEVIESGTIQQQKDLKKILDLKIKMLDEKINEAEKSKKVEFTERQLEFRRDDALPLCKKYFNKKYETYKNEILTEIKKKFNNCKNTKLKIDEKYSVYVKFFEELKASEENKAA
jgi:hypothetical protein